MFLLLHRLELFCCFYPLELQVFVPKDFIAKYMTQSPSQSAPTIFVLKTWVGLRP